MNKLTIPIILAITVLVAGIFASMPIQNASTVHTSLQANIENAPRALFWGVEGGGRTLLMQLDAGQEFKADRIVVSNLAGESDCTVEDNSGDDLAGPAAAGATAGATDIQAGVTANFAVGEDIFLETPTAGTPTCTVTIYVEELEIP